jgi:hypothetical protein
MCTSTHVCLCVFVRACLLHSNIHHFSMSANQMLFHPPKPNHRYVEHARLSLTLCLSASVCVRPLVSVHNTSG